MSFFQMCNCCGEPPKKPVFIIGPDKEKKWFLEQFGITIKDDVYQEFKAMVNGELVLFSCLSQAVDDPNVEELHTKACLGVVVLSEHDVPVTTNKPTFFIYTGGQSNQLSNGNFIVHQKDANVKEEFEKFLKEFDTVV